MAGIGDLKSRKRERTTRAEQVRAAHSQHRTQPLAGLGSERRSRRKRQINVPPVLVRSGLEGMATPSKRQTRPKRRYDVALNVPGAELRLPSIPSFQVGWRLASASLVMLLGALLYYLWTAPQFHVEVVEVDGLKRLTIGDINAVLGLTGEPVFALDPQEIQANMEKAFPELTDVQLNIGLPARVRLSVVERQPVVSWVQDGQEVWVDADGVSFPPRGEADNLVNVQAQSLPSLQGEAPASQDDHQLLPPKMVALIQRMAALVPEGQSMIFDKDHGFGWTDQWGWNVYFGRNMQNMDMKLRVYEALADYLVQNDLTPEFVSVENVHAPYYRLER